MSRIISVVSGKGGVGKTTLVVNTGVALAQLFGKKVSAIDCNLTTSHLGMALGIHHAPVSLNSVLRGEAPIEEALYSHSSGLHILPASLKLSDMSGVDLVKLRPLIRSMADRYDIVLLDAGPGLGREALSALHSSQEVVFVATPTLPAVMDVLRYTEFLREKDKKHLGVVLNMVARNESQMTADQVEKMLGLPVITSIPRDLAIPRAQAAEVPAILAFPDSKASKELVNVARHILGMPVSREVRVSTLDSLKMKATGFMEKLSRFPSLD
ncbi:MAG: cell division ATPase MinD [Candidatus Micrarchaeota archaeon]